MKTRPLEKYFKSEEDIILTNKSKTFDIINKTLCKINSKIKKTKNKINIKTDELINLIMSNASKHKQFLKQNEINDVQDHLNNLFKHKRTILLSFF